TYAAFGAGQAGQFVGQRADVLADERLQDGRQVQLLLLDQLLLLGARLAQVHDALLTALLDGRYVDRGRVGAGLTLHPWSLRGPRWRAGDPGRVSSADLRMRIRPRRRPG